MSYNSLTFPLWSSGDHLTSNDTPAALASWRDSAGFGGRVVTPEQVVAEQRVDQGVKGVLAGLRGV